VAHALLTRSPLEQWRTDRYASFDTGDGRAFADGRLGMEDLRAHAVAHGEPVQRSGKQERYENLVNQFLLRA
jgi:xylose isomerase